MACIIYKKLESRHFLWRNLKKSQVVMVSGCEDQNKCTSFPACMIYLNDTYPSFVNEILDMQNGTYLKET